MPYGIQHVMSMSCVENVMFPQVTWQAWSCDLTVLIKITWNRKIVHCSIQPAGPLAQLVRAMPLESARPLVRIQHGTHFSVSTYLYFDSTVCQKQKYFHINRQVQKTWMAKFNALRHSACDEHVLCWERNVSTRYMASMIMRLYCTLKNHLKQKNCPSALFVQMAR